MSKLHAEYHQLANPKHLNRFLDGNGALAKRCRLPGRQATGLLEGQKHVATSLPSRRDTLQAYRRRMWIEEMFGDLKGNGFDMESTHLRHFARLSRLTLAVVLLCVWLVSTGARGIKNGQRHLVDRKDRRDLSVFRIGLRLIERRLTNVLSISIPLCPVYGCKLSGS